LTQTAKPVTGLTAASRHFAGAAGCSADGAGVSAGWVDVSEWAATGSHVVTPNATTSVFRSVTMPSSVFAQRFPLFVERLASPIRSKSFARSPTNDIEDV
jgi:hypothetical protein